MKKYSIALALLLLIFATISCDKNDNFVVFSIGNDIQLGQQVKDEIFNSPEYEILLPEEYPQVYTQMYAIRDAILNSGEIAYDEDFAWELYVIHDDENKNAFAVPGGYLFIYTGLIKYLDHIDDLAGVMAHEIAHADERHTIRNLQKVYGVNLLLNIALGEHPSDIEVITAQIAGTLAGLSFSRQYEEEADAHSVEYLAPTMYACNAAAQFFVKMEQLGEGGNVPTFLSTHPSPVNRISNINEEADEIGCDTSPSSDEKMPALQVLLP